MNVVGLFSGIGGLELPFHRRGNRTLLMCELWHPAQSVLKAHFADVPIHPDITTLHSLPGEVDVVTAGFPCTDLSQAGKTAGINGPASGLVSHVFRLIESQKIQWLVLENVKNMLVLDRGQAMRVLVSKLEQLGFCWAYRVVDSRCSGLPHRRHRVLFVASRLNDPREVLFADDVGPVDEHSLDDSAFGFYWTEGYTGLGWARDAVPPLKGGSTVGIPSPPAIWLRGAQIGRRIVIPKISDAEILQGFDAGWTEPTNSTTKNGPRWKLVGNAVTVGVSEWLVQRLANPGAPAVLGELWSGDGKWPEAAFGSNGRVWKYDLSAWPIQSSYKNLKDVVDIDNCIPLSHRAALGFLNRTKKSQLRFLPEFLDDVNAHVIATQGRGDQLPLFQGSKMFSSKKVA